MKQLKIKNCEKLQYLVDHREDTCTSLSSSLAIQMENINKSSISLLEKFSISHCSSVTCMFLKGQFPASLKHLEIEYCSELTILSPRDRLPEALEVLEIKECPKLESIVERFLNNTSLRYIELRCKNLKSLPMGLQNLIHLSRFVLCDCPSLVSFPEGGLPKTNLEYLDISGCEKLRALPDHLHDINSLQTLYIERCPSINSLQTFPQDGFSTNITSLSIEGLNIYKPLVEWGLHNLTSLTDLSISGCPEAKSFPQEEIGMMLPQSLTNLTIESFSKLKYLFPNGFQNLTSLESLSILSCPNLTSFPDVGLPPSLLELCIIDCPNLTSFPDVGLPPSLLKLCINKCPLLKKQCKRDKGREWSKLSHIPFVRIDLKFIYDPEEE